MARKNYPLGTSEVDRTAIDPAENIPGAVKQGAVATRSKRSGGT
jgi:hypothetical protein